MWISQLFLIFGIYLLNARSTKSLKMTGTKLLVSAIAENVQLFFGNSDAYF